MNRDASVAPISVPAVAQLAEAMPDPGVAFARRRQVEYREARQRRPRSAPVETVVQVDEVLLDYARRITGGDMSRVRINRDGSILISNRGRGD